ncbi:hypothetical protein HPB48_011217 [Haemaphysalis longicornis]|uniref:Uncharacterized protein n=1 Tax=Haemaphysalis longicornis TaxID=44386 RepID=A0A9J6GAB5_HAELO|nr:hypothetical protein HPB48_011217 [Haemaphysalis longicornis]
MHYDDDHAERDAKGAFCLDHVYYMSHHEVIRQASTTSRLRVVVHASSHVFGTYSLNSLLKKGPNHNVDLSKMLIKFRLFVIEITADVQNGFLQISIRDEERDALRFLSFEEIPSATKALPRIQEMQTRKYLSEARLVCFCYLLLCNTTSLTSAATTKKQLKSCREAPM